MELKFNRLELWTVCNIWNNLLQLAIIAFLCPEFALADCLADLLGRVLDLFWFLKMLQ